MIIGPASYGPASGQPTNPLKGDSTHIEVQNESDLNEDDRTNRVHGEDMQLMTSCSHDNGGSYAEGVY